MPCYKSNAERQEYKCMHTTAHRQITVAAGSTFLYIYDIGQSNGNVFLMFDAREIMIEKNISNQNDSNNPQKSELLQLVIYITSTVSISTNQ